MSCFSSGRFSARASRRLFISFLAVLCLGLAGSAHAAFTGLLNVDFNSTIGGGSPTASGSAVIGAGGDTWNGFSFPFDLSAHTASNLPLVDSTNAATSVTLSYNNPQGAYDVGSNGFTGTPQEDLMRDYLFADNGGQGTVSLGGLTANTTYELYLYSQANPSSRVTQFTVNGVNKNAASNEALSTFVEGSNFVHFTVNASALGVLDFSYTGFGRDEGNLNGFQLFAAAPTPGVGGNPVPVPPALMLGLAGAGMVWPMKRRICKR